MTKAGKSGAVTWHPDMPESYKNVIVTGDARELARALPDESVDFFLWDPDYGVGMDYGYKLTGDEAIEFIELLLPTLKAKSRSGQAIVFWSGSIGRIKAFLASRIDEIWPIHYMGIWYKPNGAGASGNGLGRRFEVWFWLKDGPKPHSEWTRLPDVLAISRVVPGHIEAVGHPSQKPIELLERLIRFFTVPGDVVCDPTIGSGSTAVAAKRLGRKFIGFELNPGYAAMARQRAGKAQPPLFTMQPQQAKLELEAV